MQAPTTTEILGSSKVKDARGTINDNFASVTGDLGNRLAKFAGVSSEADLTSLTHAEPLDFARTVGGAVYQLTAAPYSVLANWKKSGDSDATLSTATGRAAALALVFGG